ncbi:hypothetical protein [Rhodopirellula europaea]|uniref:hypothetical protein n=1 Tax=Rhodopirellula europaea TaxID=1263866 RepID=UPI003D2714DB
MKLHDALTRLEPLRDSLVAIEALWDGDSSGWFVFLCAVTSDHESHHLITITDGGDIRLINGGVPPWPEAKTAQQMGSQLADQCAVDFYFPSPDHPEDRCPRWVDRERGYPCADCGIPLYQTESLPWHGTCYECHLKSERDTK